MKEKVRLIHTTGHYKFYEMEDLGNGILKCSYGRIDSTSNVVTYLMSQWDKKYREKINKGYVDVSKTIKKFSLQDIFANLELLEERLK